MPDEPVSITAQVPGLASWRLRLRENRLLLLVELALVAAVFIADNHHLIYRDKTPCLLAIAWGSIALRGVRWSDLGFRLDDRWRVFALAGVLAGMVIEGLHLFITQPLIGRMLGQVPNIADYADLPGHFSLLMSLIASAWILAGLGKELVWRGYVLNRLNDLFGRTGAGGFVAVAFATVAYGLAHAPEGSISVVEHMVDAVALAWLYRWSGRNLMAPIIAHGLTDTINYLVIYSGHYPGMG